MPTKKGIRKPKHTQETKELAVSLYMSSPTITLNDVADQLNAKFHFDPPLSSDSVGRWVQEKKHKMKRPRDLIWLKRRQRYGKSGLKAAKREALSKHREDQWSDPRYRQRMSEKMSRIPQDVKDRVVDLYRKGTMPSKIKRALKEEQLYVPSHTGLYQILKRRNVPIWHMNARISSIDSIIDVPCLVCLLNKEVSPYYCVPASCHRVEAWLLSLV